MTLQSTMGIVLDVPSVAGAYIRKHFLWDISCGFSKTTAQVELRSGRV